MNTPRAFMVTRRMVVNSRKLRTTNVWYPIRPAAPFNLDTRQDPMFAFDHFLAGHGHFRSQGFNQPMADYSQPSGPGLTNSPFDPFNAYQLEPPKPQGNSPFTQSDLEAFRDLVSTMPSLS
ncbi:hypothetical protein K474DRAFT_1668723 [Panus rudis PR-1116 ss-1]|nr:hypothetical protein K474DRAFT_1668723 [Panus rudis PR-1116 ss-1]